MSMSTHVTGYISEDSEEYQKHKRILLMCDKEGVSLPKETHDYFGDETNNVEMLLEEKLECEIPKHEFNRDMDQGFEVFISEIPKGVHKIRFVNSY